MWCKAIFTASSINNNLVRPDSKKSPSMMFQNKQDDFFDWEKMQPFGRIGYVANQKKFQKKFTPKALPMSFIGYPVDHASDNYKMYNHVTKKAIVTRDISKWEEFNREMIKEIVPLFDTELAANHRLYKLLEVGRNTGVDTIEFEEDELDEYEEFDDDLKAIVTQNLAPSPVPNQRDGIDIVPDDDSSDDEEIPVLGDWQIIDDDIDDDDHADIANGEEDRSDSSNDSNGGDDDEDDDDRKNKLQRELAKLDADLADVNLDEGIRTQSRAYFVDVSTDEIVLNAESVNSEGNAPKTFKQASESPLKAQWMSAARREIDNFMKRDAWYKIKRTELPKGQKPLKVKWVFKVKENETREQRYKGRIVIKGYTKIPGVDYTKSFAPVATTSSINMIIASGLYRK
jgi:hypothetical protein